MVWLQILSTLISLGLKSPATVLFTRMPRGLLTNFTRPPVIFDNDENNHTNLMNRQPNVNEDVPTLENIPLPPAGSTVVMQC